MEGQQFPRTAGLWCAFGAAIATVGAIITGSIPTTVPTTSASYPFSPTVYSVTQILWATCQFLMFLGVLGLARSGAIGTSRLGTAGKWLALVGMAAMVPFIAAFAFIATEQVDSPRAAALSSAVGLASNVAGVGLILVGIAVLRAGRWHGWQRFTPLLCGLYVFVALTPILAAFSGLFFWGIAGWSACFILLGLALVGQRATLAGAAFSPTPA